MLLQGGLSGCKLELVSDTIVRKYSSGSNYDDRFRKQILKQISLGQAEFRHIRIPPILSVNESPLSFDMPYIKGANFTSFLKIASPQQLNQVLDGLNEYFTHVSKSARAYDPLVLKRQITNKLKSLDTSQYRPFIHFLLERTESIDLGELPCSFCHGDLTLANILFGSKHLYFLDFLDSYVDSFVIDLVKLKQDLYWGWAIFTQQGFNWRVTLGAVYLWKQLALQYKQYVDTDLFRLLDAVNFLRIEPYLTHTSHKWMLKYIIQELDLYADFNRSNGGKIISVS